MMMMMMMMMTVIINQNLILPVALLKHKVLRTWCC